MEENAATATEDDPQEAAITECASQDEVSAAVSALGGAGTNPNTTTLFLDLYPGCDVCGGDHLTEECPELGLSASSGDFKVMSKARLTLPSNLVLLEHMDASLTVVAQEVIPAKTQFGPFEARRTTEELEGNCIFTLKILAKDGTIVSLYTSNENECNWMCLVQCAQTEEEQNCIAYQLGTNIFYSSIKNIEQGEQLKVWYASHYAKKLGKPVKPSKGYKVMLAFTVKDSDGIVVSPEVAMLEHQQVTEAASVSSEQMTTIHEVSDKFYRNRILSLIQGDEMKEYKCSKCDNIFNNQVDLAKHLRAHLVPSCSSRGGKVRGRKSRFQCSVCNIGFVNKSNYQRHMKRHKGQVLRCVECGYRSYRLDVMWNHLFSKHRKLKLQGVEQRSNLFEYEDHVPEDTTSSLEQDDDEEAGERSGTNDNVSNFSDGSQSYSELTGTESDPCHTQENFGNTLVPLGQGQENKSDQSADTSSKENICDDYCTLESSTETNNLLVQKNFAGRELGDKNLNVIKTALETDCEKPDITKIALLEAKITLEDGDMDYKEKEGEQSMGEVSVSDAFKGFTDLYMKPSSLGEYIQDSTSSGIEHSLPVSTSNVQMVQVTEGQAHDSISEIYKHIIETTQPVNDKRILCDSVKCENFLVAAVEEMNMSVPVVVGGETNVTDSVEEMNMSGPVVGVTDSVVEMSMSEPVVGETSVTDSVVEMSMSGPVVGETSVTDSVVEMSMSGPVVGETSVTDSVVEMSMSGPVVGETSVTDSVVEMSMSEPVISETSVTDSVVEMSMSEPVVGKTSVTDSVVEMSMSEPVVGETSVTDSVVEMSMSEPVVGETSVTDSVVEMNMSEPVVGETSVTDSMVEMNMSEPVVGETSVTDSMVEMSMSEPVVGETSVTDSVVEMNMSEPVVGETSVTDSMVEMNMQASVVGEMNVTDSVGEMSMSEPVVNETNVTDSVEEGSIVCDSVVSKTADSVIEESVMDQAVHVRSEFAEETVVEEAVVKEESVAKSVQDSAETEFVVEEAVNNSEVTDENIATSEAMRQAMVTEMAIDSTMVNGQVVDEMVANGSVLEGVSYGLVTLDDVSVKDEETKVIDESKSDEVSKTNESQTINKDDSNMDNYMDIIGTSTDTMSLENVANAESASGDKEPTVDDEDESKTAETNVSQPNKLIEFVDYVADVIRQTEETETQTQPEETAEVEGVEEGEVTAQVLESQETKPENGTVESQEDGAEEEELFKKRRKPGRPRKRTRQALQLAKKGKTYTNAEKTTEPSTPKKAKPLPVQSPPAMSTPQSPARVLPTRRLKGIRTTGNKAEEEEEADKTTSPTSEKTKIKKILYESVKPGMPRRRGRPPKILKVQPTTSPTTTPVTTRSTSAMSPVALKVRLHQERASSKNKSQKETKSENRIPVKSVKRSDDDKDTQEDLSDEPGDEMEEGEVESDEGEVMSAEEKDSSATDDSTTYVVDIGDGKRRRKIRSKDDENFHPDIDMLIDKTDDGILYACCICGKRFTNIKYLKLHAPAHTDRFRCELCNKRFTRKESLMKHRCTRRINSTILQTVEDDKVNFTCGECGKTFSRPEYAKRHFAMHTDIWKCEKCNRQFSRRHLLASHVCNNLEEEEEEGGKNSVHQCDICEQSFRTVKYLYRHLAMHTDIFKCEQCGRCFSRKDSMQKHILRCDPARAAAENIHSCHNCGRTFSTKLGLENHLLHCFSLHCFKCRRSFAAEEDLKDHECVPLAEEISKENDGKLTCQVCKKSFANLQYLNNHEATHKGTFQCDICLKGFSRNEELNWHKRLCMGDAVIKRDGFVECDKCDAKFEDAKEYRDHYQQHTHPFDCLRCGKRFVKRGSLQTHSCHRLLEGDEARCEICYKTFRSDKYLSRHQIIHGEPQFQCEVCHKKFYRKDYLNDHSCRLPDGSLVRVVRRHNQVFIRDNLICHLCGKSFVSVSNLNKHLKCHGEKTCECDICGKRFHYITYLKEHKAAVHENKYQHQCAECGKIVKTKTSLVSHMKQFHSEAPPNYACKTCGKVFRQKGNMKTHMFSHSQEKHFNCSFCGKKFKYPDQLNRHRLEHTMTNKLECEHCGKKFVKGYELRKHIQIFHSGMMYICDCCNAKCGHRHTLIRHYRRKHPEKLYMLREPNFLGNLLKQVARSQKDLVKTEPDSLKGNKEETIITLGADASIAVATAEGLLPQMAAEALHSLSSTMFTSQEDTIQVPEIHPTVVEEEGGHTVVILQFVNQGEEGEEETVICGQEVTPTVTITDASEGI